MRTSILHTDVYYGFLALFWAAWKNGKGPPLVFWVPGDESSWSLNLHLGGCWPCFQGCVWSIHSCVRLWLHLQCVSSLAVCVFTCSVCLHLQCVSSLAVCVFTCSVCIYSTCTCTHTYFLPHSQFEKPGSREDFDYPDMAKEAGKLLSDYTFNPKLLADICFNSNACYCPFLW